MTLVLLAGVALDGRARARGDLAPAYHERVRGLAEAALPYSVGDWIGQDLATSRFAVELLHPNVLINRRYENLRTGETANLLFVQCTDARDLLGHFPPVCYPAHGLTSRSVTPVDWSVADATIPGTRYRFGDDSLTRPTEMVVDNFMVLPTAELGRDMRAVDTVARDPRLRHFGAAQVQVLTDGTMSDTRRNEVFAELVASMQPLLASLNAEANDDD